MQYSFKQSRLTSQYQFIKDAVLCRLDVLSCFFLEAISYNKALFIRASSEFIMPPSSCFLMR
jgi:hypothetical protein